MSWTRSVTGTHRSTSVISHAINSRQAHITRTCLLYSTLHRFKRWSCLHSFPVYLLGLRTGRKTKHYSPMTFRISLVFCRL